MKQRRTVWTDELKAEVAKRIRFGFSVVEVSEATGVSCGGIYEAVRKYNLLTKEEMNERKRQRRAEQNRCPKMRAALSRHMKRRWKDKDYRARTVAMLDASTQETRLNFSRLVTEFHAAARGFEIPDELRPEYTRLTRIYRYSPAEAGRILGLLEAA